MTFFTVHEKLEEYYNEVNEQIDEIAEHILMIGGQAIRNNARVFKYYSYNRSPKHKNRK